MCSISRSTTLRNTYLQGKYRKTFGFSQSLGDKVMVFALCSHLVGRTHNTATMRPGLPVVFGGYVTENMRLPTDGPDPLPVIPQVTMSDCIEL